ncbi:MAG: DEAD/DEAH box helicase family protein [Synergistaceae bacterium]|jgi:superfamily II DNA or RNA helicase|nr:DEAD/DEAH box helicase family protein [Synergistaceae bacterium]
MYALKNIALHQWQAECLKRWFGNGRRGIAGVATGAGKTVLALAVVSRLSELCPEGSLKVKIIVPKIFLAGQWRDDILRCLRVRRRDIGLYYGEFKDSPDKPFMIYVLATARRWAARHILEDARAGSSVFLICDECHHFGSTENAHVFDFLPHMPAERYFALGLSATPQGENYEGVVVPALGREIYRYDLARASRDRITSDYMTFNIAVDFAPDEEEKYLELTEKITRLKTALKRLFPSFCDGRGRVMPAYLRSLLRRADEVGELAQHLFILYLRRKEVTHTARSRISCGMELVRLLMPDCRMILFTERIRMADELYEMLRRSYPGRICRYHSHMDPRAKQRALESYRQGERSAIVCCRALDEGLNVPETDAGILISATGNDRQRIQRIGRVVRLGAGLRPKKIYYLHVSGTTDPQEIIPQKPGVAAHSLYYDSAANRFLHPEYDELAAKTLDKLAASGATAPRIENAEAQLARGVVMGDFTLPEEACLRHIEDAGPEEKDYWIAMLLMSRERAR